MKSANRHTLIVILALFAVLGLTLSVHASAEALGPKATLSKAKKKAKHRTQKTATPTSASPALRTIFVAGEDVAICGEGFCPGFSVFSATATATCPSGYAVIGGGWESNAGDAPRGSFVTANHAVSDRWVVTLGVDFPRGGTPYRIAHFHAIATCQILLPA